MALGSKGNGHNPNHSCRSPVISPKHELSDGEIFLLELPEKNIALSWGDGSVVKHLHHKSQELSPNSQNPHNIGYSGTCL